MRRTLKKETGRKRRRVDPPKCPRCGNWLAWVEEAYLYRCLDCGLRMSSQEVAEGVAYEAG